jgi:hypothetical protein
LESVSGLTRVRVAVWRPGDGGEEVAVEALGVGDAWVWREEKRRRGGGEVRWRMVKPAQRSPGLERRWGGQTMTAKRWRRRSSVEVVLELREERRREGTSAVKVR